MSHLLEHMAFKGTTRRTSQQIAEEIEAVGGDLNAATSNETTAYYARVLKADVPLALDVLSDILANPSFDSEELEREKSVIEQEIGAAQDTPDDVIFEHLSELSYPDQPMGRSLLGTPQTLASFDRDNLNNYLTTHYRGPDMVVAAARGRRSPTASSPKSNSALRVSRARRRRSRCLRCSARAARASFIAISNRRI